MSLSKEQETALDNAIIQRRNALRSDSLNMSFSEIISMYSNDELIFRPFQKVFHWNIEKRTQFIESLLLGLPMFEIMVVSNSDTGNWQLLDGLQRVVTVLSFFGQLRESELNIDFISDQDKDKNTSPLNNWVMTQGKIIKELEGLSCENISSKIYFMIKRSVCSIRVIDCNLEDNIYHELFNRLNINSFMPTLRKIH